MCKQDHCALSVLGLVVGCNAPAAPTDGSSAMTDAPRLDTALPHADTGVPDIDTGTAVPDTGGTVITPDMPGPSDVRFAIDSTSHAVPISPYIYGLNAPNWSDASGATITRFGGNRITAYNWENNASNAGSDYLFENVYLWEERLAEADRARRIDRVARQAQRQAVDVERRDHATVGCRRRVEPVERSVQYPVVRLYVHSPSRLSLARQPTHFFPRPAADHT